MSFRLYTQIHTMILRKSSSKLCLKKQLKRLKELHLSKKTVLSIKDDGVGLPKELDIYTTQSMGMQLISALAVQLNAKIQVNRSNGTLFELRFLNK